MTADQYCLSLGALKGQLREILMTQSDLAVVRVKCAEISIMKPEYYSLKLCPWYEFWPFPFKNSYFLSRILFLDLHFTLCKDHVFYYYSFHMPNINIPSPVSFLILLNNFILGEFFCLFSFFSKYVIGSQRR